MDKPINNNWPKYPGEDSVFIREATEQELMDDANNKTGGIQSWYTKKELTKTGNYDRRFNKTTRTTNAVRQAIKLSKYQFHKMVNIII